MKRNMPNSRRSFCGRPFALPPHLTPAQRRNSSPARPTSPGMGLPAVPPPPCAGAPSQPDPFVRELSCVALRAETGLRHLPTPAGGPTPFPLHRGFLCGHPVPAQRGGGRNNTPQPVGRLIVASWTGKPPVTVCAAIGGASLKDRIRMPSNA